MHSRNNRTVSLDNYFAGIRDLLPAVDALIERHRDTRLRDYVDLLGQGQARPLQCRRDFVAEVAAYTGETLGPGLGAAIAEELHEMPQVLTANHHGIDTFAQSTQSNLLFSLRRRADGGSAKTIPVLACGTVPLNNLTYPRGLLIYACEREPGEAGICKLPLFPDSHKRKLVNAAQPYTAEMLGRARSRAERLRGEAMLSPPVEAALDSVLDEFSRIGEAFPDYSRQATVVNHRLWQRLFRDDACRSELVYVELESIARGLLLRDLFDRSTICHQLLFDPVLRRRLVEKLDGRDGCWQREKLARRGTDGSPAGSADAAMGTMFFWGVDAKARRVPLHVVEPVNGGSARLCGEDDRGNAWTIPLTPDALARELRERRLLPSIFTSYLLISIARGVSCIGGYYQADYLPVMRRAVDETIGQDPGEAPLARGNGAPATDYYLSGMQTVGFRAGDRLLPAGPLEIIASGGLGEAQYDGIGNITVLQAHLASLFDIVIDVAPHNHELQHVKQEISRLAQDRVGDEIVTISMDSMRAAS